MRENEYSLNDLKQMYKSNAYKMSSPKNFPKDFKAYWNREHRCWFVCGPSWIARANTFPEIFALVKVRLSMLEHERNYGL
jgi:hypothetical protein